MAQDNQNKGKTENEMTDSGTEENFADLLEGTYIDSGMLEPGQRVEAQIVKITGESIFINIGGKSEGYLPTEEMMDRDGKLTVKEGDIINVFFLSAKKGEQLFTTKIAGGQAGRTMLETAYENEIPVEGLVEKEVKGGYEVKIGSQRAFCPYSQMGLNRTENPEKYIGLHMTFKISEYSENGRNIVLSHRAILEEERGRQEEVLKKTLQAGMKIKGKVQSIQDFGAFVDIGGVQALLPVSEIDRSRVEDIKQYLTVGQEIEAVILNLDWDSKRISISLKEAMPDPWDTVEKNYKEGAVHTGKVARLTNFGAFVTLENGLDGLIHISDLGGGKKIKHPKEVLSEKQSIQVQVRSIDKEKKRISLIPLFEGREKEEEEDFKQFMDKKDETFKPLGNLGNLLKDKFPKK